MCLVTCINVGVRVQRYGHSKRKEIIVVFSEGLESDAAGFLMFFLCRFNTGCVTLWVKLGIFKNAAGCSDNIAL